MTTHHPGDDGIEPHNTIRRSRLSESENAPQKSKETHRLLEVEHTSRRAIPLWLNFTDTWSWEGISIGWFLACLAANIGILVYISGKSLKTWNLPIEPNTLVGVFSTLSKAALATPVTQCISQLKWLYFEESPRPLINMQNFDDASRGPFGALLFFPKVFFSKNKSKAVRVAAIGCLVTLATLALEPFTQQVIGFRDRIVLIDDGTEIARFSVSNGYDTGATSLTGLFTPELTDDDMQGSLLAGIFSKTIDTNRYETCSSSNCTWPAASSLSICSACHNVTAASKKECTDPKVDIMISPRQCNFTTPGGIKLGTQRGRAQSAQFYYTMANVSCQTEFSSTRNTTGMSNDAILARIGILRDPALRQVPGYPDNATISECEIFWCKTTYAPVSGMANSSQHTNTTRERLIYEGAPARFRIAMDRTNSSRYSLNQINIQGIKALLTGLFTTDLASELSPLNKRENFNVARLVHRAPDLDELFDSITLAMTAELRSSSRNTTEVSGQAWRNETYIHVRWGWFALPVAIFSMTVLLFITTVVMNRRIDGMLWKSSLLPYMFIGKSWSVSDIKTHGGVAEMEEVARMKTFRTSELKVMNVNGTDKA
ncbi:hypothetical protein B0J11DRAFT_567909 [Dendryphion nanum]|uniref:Uncharacterized protein n=1 Tax=Dendryphion nanum TaxID=256645 RepID=A0A9P9INW5_9PLEO|nr:hypothetical protein B0J11DRAFT_567909 [Dendryphion nanum]